MKTGGELGNRRLTAASGLLLLGLLFLEGLTLPVIHRLLAVHIFLGFLLVPPVALKLASTGYRAVKYYLGSRRYREVGPPLLLLRVLGPFVVVATVVLIWSGVELVVLGPTNSGPWRRVHTVSFILWFGLMTIHVLAHVWKATINGLAEIVPTALPVSIRAPSIAGTLSRRFLVAGSVLLGVALATSLLPLDASWTGFTSGH